MQKIVFETVEESSSSRTIFDSEIKKLQQYIWSLQMEITQLKNEKSKSPQHTTDSSSLAPSVVLSAVTKKIVKKLDAFSSQENVEEKVVVDFLLFHT